MADGRDLACWNNHALEQEQTNPQVHSFDKNVIWKQWLRECGDEVKEVVDLGCGGGLWRDLFRGYSYVGIDQSPGMIASANKRGVTDQQRFILMDRWDRIPFEDNSVDMIWTAAVLQHNLHKDKEQVVREIVRVLKPSGWYMCTENTFREDNYRHTFRNEPQWRPDLDDGYSFTRLGWEGFMKARGLDLVHFQDPSEYLFRKA